MTAAIYNADHQNHITNHIPSQMDDYSSDATEMKTQTTPGTVGSESLAQNMSGELERLRYAMARHAGLPYWYSASDVYNVKAPEYGAVGDGVADDTAAIQAAITAASANSVVYLPPGVYLVTSTLTISADRVHFIGAGPYATRITFVPTANDVCLNIVDSGNVMTQGSVREMTFWSTDTTYTKTAIDIEDVSGYRFYNLVIGGSNTIGGAGHWGDAADTSIGIQTRGRDTTALRDITIFASKAIVISVNPNAANISIDHWNFHNMYIFAANNPIVTLDAGVVLTEVSFTGYQAWIHGDGGLYWVDATAPGTSHGLVLENIRYENSDDPTKYFVHIDLTSALQQFQIRGGQAGTTKGFYLRTINSMTIRNFSYTDTANREAMNADSTVKEIVFTSAFWQTGTTASLTNLVVYKKGPVITSGPLPNNGYIVQQQSPSFGTYDELLEGTLAGASRTLTTGARTEIGDASQTGFVLIATTQNSSAMFMLRGSTKTTAEISDPDNKFSASSGNANTFNVFWHTTTSGYVVENMTAAARNIYVTRFGRGQ